MVSARGILLGAAAALFSILISLAVIGIALEPAFSSSFYKDSFARHNLYGRLRVALANEQPSLQSAVSEELIRSVLDAFVENIMAYVKGETGELMQIQEPFAPAIASKAMLDQLRSAYSLRPALLLAAGAGAVVMLGIMLYLTRSSVKKMAHMAGKTLLFAGLSGFFTFLAVQQAVSQQVPATSATSETAQVMADVAAATTKDLVGAVMQTVLMYSVGFAAIGLALLLFSWRCRESERPGRQPHESIS